MPQFDSTGGIFSSSLLSQRRFLKLLNRAKTDSFVKEVIIHIDSPRFGWARADEISRAISTLSKTKPVTCLLESADNMSYWMAVGSCSRLFVAPAGSVDLIGLCAEAVFLKNMLDRFGIQADMMSVGKYKSAAENLTRTNMSEPAKEATKSLLSDLTGQFTLKIAKGRKLDTQKVKELIDSGPYTPLDAKKAGLVDDVKSISTLLSTLQNRYKGGVKTDYGKKPAKQLNLSELLKMFGTGQSEPDSDKLPKVAIIPVIGPINGGMGGNELLGTDSAVFDMPLINTLLKAAKDNSVKAVVLRIDSPGGSALASDNIWEAVSILARKKPVIASMGDVAASGGYYIASAATEIYAGKTTITGSIGVVGGKIVFGNAMENFGVTSDIVKMGKNSNIMSPIHPFTDTERATIMKSMKDVYYLFIKRVSKGRKLETKDIFPIAQGRVWSGTKALKFSLVDKEGTLDDAIARAKELAGFQGIKASVYPKPKSFMEILGEELTGQSTQLKALSLIPHGFAAINMGLLLAKEQVLTFTPFVLDIR
jgi:protease-4